ncbi:BREX-4 system phosphatase PglZ [Candidatus Cryosericum hinesii]|jgi:hypothetical protein|nr:BREX-4 system phosphatase PglZ [Candidatus Cryosericum hinesii]
MSRTIGSVQDLALVIRQDLLSENGGDLRYPWRFVFVPTLWGLKPVETELRSCLGEEFHVVDVTSEQREAESVITSDDVLRLMQKCEAGDQSWVITGLSEVLRFKSDEDFEALMRGITECENHGENRTGRRFYIPLAGLHERFQKLLWNKANRESSGLWPSVWKIDQQIGGVLKVVLFGQPLDVPAARRINSYKEFLSLWQGEPMAAVLVSSQMVADLYDMAPKDVFPDSAVNISRVSGYEKYLRDVLGVDVPVSFRNQDVDLWRQFVEDMQVASEPRLQNTLCQRFNVAQFGLTGCLKYWPASASDKYSRWLLRVGVCTLFPYSYLAKCMRSLEELDSAALMSALLSGAIGEKDDRTPERLKERRDHLDVLTRSAGQSTELPEKLQRGLAGLPPSERMRVLTDTTPWERAQFVLLFADATVPRDLWFDAVEHAFPLLYDYAAPLNISGLSEPLSWVNAYFNEYRACCLVDMPSESLRAELARVNTDERAFYEWYYAARKHETAEGLLAQGTRALMVDGMGWEWVPFITRQLHRRGLDVTDLAPMAAQLPSTTEFNRFGSGVVGIDKSPDAVAHKAPYKYPQTLLEELEVMGTAVEEQMAQPGTVVLADHGLTVFSRSVAALSKYNMEGQEHEGRCAWLAKAEKSCSDFLVHDVLPQEGLRSGPVALSLGYSSLYQIGTHLAHGGATPEEVLVPSFIVRLLDEVQKQYEIKQIVEESAETSRQVVFTVTPEPLSAPKVTVGQKDIHVSHSADGTWRIQLPNDAVGSVSVTVAVGTVVVTWMIPVKAGMTERELF